MSENQTEVKSKTPKWLADFQAFIMRGNVIDLAVGIIIGAAFTAIVNSLVKDILNPVIGLIIGGIDFSNLFITLKGQHVQTLAEAQKIGAVTINVGVFLNAVIQFVIVGFAVFWFVRGLNKLYVSTKKKEEKTPEKPSKEEVLLSEIRDALVAQNKNNS
ncbi:Large-conductance mechanosensitive channel (MscL) (PDB:2OAR) [Commensalibacter papalotli (ex Botero et al. 2024)]|uniref:Large-conductance mechanosensitive channel n=3 Tax=Acetobacteraceae TaxID=433 RepID=W7E706_9PROT|nr:MULTISPECIES: large-conductance mechanosensitive channel protein MscL [Commensalibacter]EUK18931.1 large-conductance mechanosensitive channel [Commensalibacter papalotli (ex Servin-Garciduenas et al. 2014)]CAI3925566.1 Large-conductance mechanosensitive channel (MscL) (PDB:2OAR) [Commensalibacter papalotli (ex Botero et al. 2024)]CAI3926518.1 Large-conductance mechanosensitive channel (MscL) (PDB:2OAR) [Commensalibacter papalotli (ex Botero et al. 2024)]